MLCMSAYCLLITLTCSLKAELRRVQLNRISRMHVKGASGSRQMAMNEPGAQQPSQMFFTWVKARPTSSLWDFQRVIWANSFIVFILHTCSGTFQPPVLLASSCLQSHRESSVFFPIQTVLHLSPFADQSVCCQKSAAIAETYAGATMTYLVIFLKFPLNSNKKAWHNCWWNDYCLTA